MENHNSKSSFEPGSSSAPLVEQLYTSRPRSSLKVIWFFISPFKYSFILLIFLSLLIGISEALNIAVLFPIASSALNVQPDSSNNLLINTLTNLSGIIPVEDKVVALSLLFLLIAALAFSFRILSIILSNNLNARIAIDNKNKLWDKLTSSDYQYFVDNKQGDLLYRLTRATDFINASVQSLMSFIVEGILSLSIFVLLLSLSWWGTVVITIVGIVYYAFSRYLSRKVSYTTGTGKYQAGQKELGVLNEYINGVKQIKASETASYWKREFNKALKTYWKLHIKDNFWIALPPLILNFILYIFIAATIVFVRVRYGSDFIPIMPQIVTFTFAALKLLPKVTGFGTITMQIMRSLPNLEVVEEFLKDTTYQRIKTGSKTLDRLKTGISFENVRFTHKNRESTLSNVSLTIGKDKMTAIAGPSGSGKSTIVDLVLRLYDASDGDIKIDGTSIRQFEIASLRRRIGFVSQEPFIYNASVRDNITFGSEYGESEMLEAAKLANAHDFISELPQGYDTVVGDRGVKLSGGEKQRLAIARAMIRKPEILILDEATSFLDYISEHAVQKAIDQVSVHTTTLIIAHRLSTIQNADMIYVLDNGTVVEQGDHDRLLQQRGKYWELYHAQGKTSEQSQEKPVIRMSADEQ